MARHLLETRSDEYLSLVARELLLSEGQNLGQTIARISKKLNVSKEKIKNFVEYLYKSNFLVKTKERFGFTLEGVNYLLNLAEGFYFTQDLEGEKRGYGKL